MKPNNLVYSLLHERTGCFWPETDPLPVALQLADSDALQDGVWVRCRVAVGEWLAEPDSVREGDGVGEGEREADAVGGEALHVGLGLRERVREGLAVSVGLGDGWAEAELLKPGTGIWGSANKIHRSNHRLLATNITALKRKMLSLLSNPGRGKLALVG